MTKWTPERWMILLQLVGGVVFWVWFAGGQWETMKREIQGFKDTAAEMQVSLAQLERQTTALKLQIETIERSDEYYRTHKRPPMFDQ